MPFSTYLDGKRGECRALVQALGKRFPYVSVLGTDVRATAIRALNQNTTILFENNDGSSEDGIADEYLPYDMKADIIDISDDQLGIFYIDSLDHPERYDGKTVRFVGQPFPENGIPQGYYYFGRLAMTCCANDIQQMGWVTQGNLKPTTRHFYRLTAKCEKRTGGDGREIVTYSF